MEQILEDYGAELLAGLLSLIAVGVSLYRAEAQETRAEAAAVSELAASSHDLRERIGELEAGHRAKDEEITALRLQAAQIPVLESQIPVLKDELSRVQREAAEMQEQLACELAARRSDET